MSAGEQLLSDYSVHELPGCDEGNDKVIDTALTTRIELLESEIQKIKTKSTGNNESRFF